MTGPGTTSAGATSAGATSGGTASPGALDLACVEVWLGELDGPVLGPLAAERVGLGQSNLTYLVTDRAQRRWIVRRPPLGVLLPSAHDMAREHRILSALTDTDVPAPQVHGLVSDGVDHVIMEYVPGLVIDTMEVAAAQPDRVRAALGPSLARTLAAIHAVDPDAVGLADLASRRPYAERQLHRWARQLDHSRTRELPRLDALTGMLQRQLPEQRETVLVHGDLHLRNVICSPHTGEVRAALDWELATLGDPWADVGTLLAYWPEPGEAPAQLFAASSLPGFSGRDELVAAYVEASGRDPGPLGFWHVLGVWKIAVIAEGVRRRALDEPANAAEGGPLPAAFIDHMTDRGWELARHYGLDARRGS